MVCRTKPIERAKRGQKDYFLSMRVVDSSLPLGITVSILRPFRHALPAGVERGDCMLFRNFKVLFSFFFFFFSLFVLAHIHVLLYLVCADCG